MVQAFKILEKAQLEFEDAVLWYELKRVGLGRRFAEVVQKKFLQIEQFPERYPVRKNGFRETPLKVFPFVIVYKFYKQRKEVVVYNVFNWSRSPSGKYR